MLTDTSTWSHARGNEVVPSRWQATVGVRGRPALMFRTGRLVVRPEPGSTGPHSRDLFSGVDPPVLVRSVAGT